jgi:hypothetical protein
MQHESSREDVSGDLDRAERAVLFLLLDPDTPPLWSATELALELGSEVIAADAITALHGAGLVHLNDGFVCLTRAASRLCALGEVL